MSTQPHGEEFALAALAFDEQLVVNVDRRLDLLVQLLATRHVLRRKPDAQVRIAHPPRSHRGATMALLPPRLDDRVPLVNPVFVSHREVRDARHHRTRADIA
jgi:hypothetical protein